MKKIVKNIAKKLGNREAPFTPGSFQEALDKHEKQLNIARETGDRAGEGKAYYNTNPTAISQKLSSAMKRV